MELENFQRYIVALYVIVLEQTACKSHGFHIDYTFTFIYLDKSRTVRFIIYFYIQYKFMTFELTQKAFDNITSGI